MCISHCSSTEPRNPDVLYAVVKKTRGRTCDKQLPPSRQGLLLGLEAIKHKMLDTDEHLYEEAEISAPGNTTFIFYNHQSF